MSFLIYFLLSAFICVLCVSFVGYCGDDDDDVKNKTSIAYTITMSPDLLKTVAPHVNYVDKNGNFVTITGVEAP